MKTKSKEDLKFLINLIFASYNLILGIFTNSMWFLNVGAYYIILSIMRISVIRFSSKNRKNEFFIMKFIGIILFILALVLCFTVYMSIKHEGATKHHEIVMITIALYAFTKLTLAIIGFVKSRKIPLPSHKTLQSIAFTDSIVSIYSLQRSMLVTFQGMTKSDIVLMNTLSGTGMCIIVICIGLNLIIGGNRMAKSKLVKGIEKISENVTKGYSKVEKTVVDGYKAVENTVVKGYEKIEDAFVDKYLTRDGETVEEAKKRLKESMDK